MYLFGYGSLINLQSAQKSFQRKLKQSDLIPVVLGGYTKIWNAIELIKFEDNIQRNGVFLNLQKQKDKSTNGVIIKLNHEELEILKKREKNYSCIEIDKKQIKNISLDENLVTFITQKEEKIAKIGQQNCFIAQKYIDILTNSFPAYDETFVKEFQKSIQPFSFEIKEGTYVFCDAIQNQFAQKGFNE